MPHRSHMRQRPGAESGSTATLPDPCRGALRRSRKIEAVRITNDGCKMTDGELAYISMVLVLFFAFIIVIGAASMGQSKRPK